MQCLCPGQQMNKIKKEVRSSGISRHSSVNGEIKQQISNVDTEEAEFPLQDGGSLNSKEARALLGKVEYQYVHAEEALRVFSGINIPALIPTVKMSIIRKVDLQKAHLQTSSPLPFHAAILLLEIVYFKATALCDLGKVEEATKECNTILDIVESALPEGLPDIFDNDCKLKATLCRAVELLPELYRLGGFHFEAVSSYRRALLSNWKLDEKAIGRIQKEFAIFLLYSGSETCSPNLQSQLDGSFVPRNNLEEAILLLVLLLRKFNLKRLERDPTVMHHLTFALSMSGQLKPLANQFEELLPGEHNRDWLYNVALCYLAEEDDLIALNLLKRILMSGEDSNSLKELLLASKICCENSLHGEEGILYARRALANIHGGCDQIEVTADLLLGISLSNQVRCATSNTKRASQQRKALEVLAIAEKKTHGVDFRVLYNLSLENAKQRKLDTAARYAKKLLKLEAGSELKTWLLMARIMSAQRRFDDAESIVNAALDQTGKWFQGDLLQIKAKMQAAQGNFKKAIETYTQLLAVIQLRTKSFNAGMSVLKGSTDDRSLEIETWYDLVLLYISMSQWRDAEICISKIKAIRPYSALACHATGKLHESKGFLKEALRAYSRALDLEPKHVPSLISTAIVLRRLGERPMHAVRCFLTDALQLDRTNHVAWFNLGLLYEDEGGSSALEAAECFQTAALLEETNPVEPFR
uniref:Uncharacterized protein n=1 Tax=Leersia perrieri TaxID=77586 RepID=A0A0D9VPB1_9ORYZ